MNKKKEFGDFQTPMNLATETVELLSSMGISPEVIIEPTAGKGNFLKAAFYQWGKPCLYRGYEINEQYVQSANENLSQLNIAVEKQDFFSLDWKTVFSAYSDKEILVLGNPPWVTNSALGSMQSQNHPRKVNFQNMHGLDAKTGKSNFDIAEWILIHLFEALPASCHLAMLCKTATARKVLKYIWKKYCNNCKSSLYHFDANKKFGVAVDACLCVMTKRMASTASQASFYSGLHKARQCTKFGVIDNTLVSDIETYCSYPDIVSGSQKHTWRSGIKHDAAKVMEFTRTKKQLINGFGESVELEDDYIYPLLKSSDVANRRLSVRKYVLVPQTHTGDDTFAISHHAPKTWEYLNRYRDVLNRRQSSIYKNRPRFSIFGIGDYSFAAWKVAISGLYKKLSFSVISPTDNKPIMLDDTCYFLACNSQDEATFICEILSSPLAIKIIDSMIFWDSKRPITIEILRHISLQKLAEKLGRQREYNTIMNEDSLQNQQMVLPFS